MEQLLPRLVPDLSFLCIEHEGKTDLEGSLPRKLRAWNVPGDRFIVIRDSDGALPGALEARLAALCATAGRAEVPVQIAYQELEAWYLGDLRALADAYAINLDAHIGKAVYRNPDLIGSPSSLVKSLVSTFQKVDGARRLGERLHPDSNNSPSFKETCDAIQELVAA